MKRFLLGLAMGVALLAPAQAQQVLRVAVNPGVTQYQPALAALYKEVGLVPEFVLLPTERALRSVENGDVDADLGRIKGGTAGYRNVLELHETLLEISLIAVVRKDAALRKLDLADLKGRRVGAVRGTKMAERAMASLDQEPILVNTTEQLYQMLLAKRFEIALVTSTALPDPDVAARTRTFPPLLSTPAVHVLNVKWASLAPRVDAALKTMKADGRWAKLTALP